MAKIKVKDLEVGMTITADVSDQNGRFLLGEGCVLTDKHLKALNAWGVISVEISGDELPDNARLNALSPEIYSTIENQVKTRFIHNDMNSPFVKELVTESVRYIAEQIRE
jgi:hypothetical protein